MKRKTVVRMLMVVAVMSVLLAGTALAFAGPVRAYPHHTAFDGPVRAYPHHTAFDGPVRAYPHHTASRHPDQVIDANEPGCNDHFAVYRSVLYNPSRVYSNNVANWGHIERHHGLTGVFNYTSMPGFHDIYMCVKHVWPFNGWSVRIGE